MTLIRSRVSASMARVLTVSLPTATRSWFEAFSASARRRSRRTRSIAFWARNASWRADACLSVAGACNLARVSDSRIARREIVGIPTTTARQAARNPIAKKSACSTNRPCPTLKFPRIFAQGRAAAKRGAQAQTGDRAAGLERIPSGLLRKLQIVHIDPKPCSDAGADGHHHDPLGAQRREAEARNKLRRAVHSTETTENRPRRRQIVHRHHCTITVCAGVEADRRPLPVYRLIAGVPCIHFAFAVA